MATAYYGHARPDVAALVPQTARRILDIGCGAGALGQALKQRQECEVWGVERDRHAASAARQVLDGVLEVDAEEDSELLPWWCPPEPFDCVVMADVLEHLRDPWAALWRAAHALAPGGCLVLSVPNVRNRQVLEGLLYGDWSYTDAGLLDRTHLRFFTRRELQKLLWRAGYRVETMTATLEPGVTQIPPGNSVSLERLHVGCDSPAEVAEFYHYQYLCRAVPREQRDFGRVSVIIPVWNQLQHTQLCWQSLKQELRPGDEVIFVDNGSTDGTGAWLSELTDEDSRVTVLGFDENRGFIQASNAGLETATGETLVLLNNDTIVPAGALAALVRGLWETPQAGLAGPMSNNVSGPQRVATTYRNMRQLSGWAWDFMAPQADEVQVVDCPRLVGFCLAARRQCMEQIGLLDERFGIGLYDDDDWCRRAVAGGWRTVIVRSSYIHHFGSVTFRQLGSEVARELLARNERLLREKYERPAGAEGREHDGPE